jgi:hypothetical protein
MSKALLKKIQELAPLISDLKTKYGLKTSDINTLSKIKSPKGFQKAVLRKLMSQQAHLKTKDWVRQADLDCGLLQDRIKYCSQIHSDIRELLRAAFVESGLVESEDFMFAGVKAYERSSQKLLEYIDKKKESKADQDAESSV